MSIYICSVCLKDHKSISSNNRKLRLLTKQQRKEKYSRYYTCSEDLIIRLNNQARNQCFINFKTGKSGYRSNMKGNYKPQNPNKYQGNIVNITYRSSWELKAMRYFDLSPNVVAWASEELVIPYISPIDRQVHRYFTDFVIKLKNGKTYVIEVKPYDQTKPPERGKKSKKRYTAEALTYITNEAKWNAAKEFCADRKIEFMILTEKELFGK